MLESTESLLPNPLQGQVLRMICVGFEEEGTLNEFQSLLTTLGAETEGRILVNTRTISPATYIGKGKVDEIRETLEKHGGIDAVAFDVELSPNQLKNLEKGLGKPVLDRSGVIIEIFSRHARTKESKTQVELAKLQYLLPRLAHFWTHFERQRGGIGQKGMGEKQIEVDRRLVKKRMSILRQRLTDIEKERDVQRSGRKTVLKVALVGYTNAGKSTLLNSLTQSHVRAEDKLFATLDASVRTLDPHSHPPIVLIDTVGFIDRLPPALVASFRSTLEELHEADLLLHIVDGSSEQAREQLEVTEKVLKELGVDGKPRITLLNKLDLIQDLGRRNRARVSVPGALQISAHNEDDITKTRNLILNYFRNQLELWEVMLPYSESKLESQLYAQGSVEIKRHLEKGTFYRLRIEGGKAKKLGLEKFRLAAEEA